MKPQELVLVLFLTNQKQTNLVDVVTSLDNSSNLKATLTNPHDNNTFLDQLSSFATVSNDTKFPPNGWREELVYYHIMHTNV